MPLLLGALFLSAFLSPASANSLGSPWPVSPALLGPATGSQMEPSIASDGSGFLVAWKDSRPAGGVYATRLDLNGNVVDPSGIRFAVHADGATVLLSASASYIVIWIDGGVLKMTRMDREGRILTPPTVLADHAFAYGSSYAATNGSRVAVAYVDQSKGQQPRVVTSTLDGRVIADVVVPTHPPNSFGYSIGSNGHDFLVAWLAQVVTQGELDGVRINEDGALKDTEPHILDFPVILSNSPAIAGDGESYLVVYQNAGFDLSARRFGSDLTSDLPHVLARFAVPMKPVWTGSRYVTVLRQNGRPIELLELDRNGATLGMPKTIADVAIGGIAQQPVIAVAAGRASIAWSDTRFSATSVIGDSSYDILAISTDSATFAPASPAVIAFSAESQQTPSIASSGGNYLVTWIEQGRLMARWLGVDGAQLHGEPLQLSPDASRAVTTFNGTNYVIAWSKSDGVHVIAMTPDGVQRAEALESRLCGPGFDLTTGPNGETLLTVGQCARRLDRSGKWMEVSPIHLPVTAGRNITGYPSAAWNGAAYLIVWQERVGTGFWLGCCGEVTNGDIKAARFTASLQSLDAGSISIGGDPLIENKSVPVVASDGDEYLIAYSTQFVWNGGRTHLRHMSRSGALLDDITLPWASSRDVVWDGERYWIAFAEYANALGLIVARSLGSSKNVVPSAPVEIATQGERDALPSLTAIAPGRIAIAYARVVEADGGVNRVFVQAMQPSGRRRSVGR